MAYLWPVIGRATVVAKRELLYAFPFGQASYLWGTLFINRSNKKDAFDKLNQESEAITATGAKLLVFPEGTRSQVDTLLPFKKGAFHIAVQSQSCIQPVVISKYWFLNSEDKSFGRGKCVRWTCCCDDTHQSVSARHVNAVHHLSCVCDKNTFILIIDFSLCYLCFTHIDLYFCHNTQVIASSTYCQRSRAKAWPKMTFRIWSCVYRTWCNSDSNCWIYKLRVLTRQRKEIEKSSCVNVL